MSTFEIVSGVEGNCLVLDGTRICGPKPWGGGRIVKTFRTDGIYEAINKNELERLKAENAKLRELVLGYDSALHRMCSQAQSYTNCHCSDCVLAKGYEDADTCSIDDIRREASRLGIEVEK